MHLRSDLPPALKYQAVIIESAARAAGLDCFEVVFELLDARDVNGIAAYGGFPVRHPSWRFGMEYERLEKGRQWGLSKIYELVINNDPTYAYLVRSNSLLEQKLVMAHVYGHADFFKHNLWFSPTNRKMLDTMGNHSTRVRRYVDAIGLEPVERFLDLAMSLDTLIDPYLPLREHGQAREPKQAYTSPAERSLRMLDALSTSPLESAPATERGSVPASELSVPARRHGPPTYDILGFLEEEAPLEAWERDLLRIVRREAYYFSPQRMTKIMNEGWASFWHSRLLTGGILDASEVLDFADCHSSATYSPPGQLNPYKLGIELFRYAEQHGEDVFRLRRVHNDVSLVHKLVDEEFALTHLVRLLPQGAMESENAPDWHAIKSWCLQQLSWGGLPQIELVSSDFEGRGELLLAHRHDGRDLQMGRAGETLRHLERVWKRPVHLMTTVEKAGQLLSVREGELRAVEAGGEGRGAPEGRSAPEGPERPPQRRAAS